MGLAQANHGPGAHRPPKAWYDSPFVVWGFAAIGTAVAAAPLFDWYHIGDKIAKAHVSDQLAASGLILAVFGFGITFFQLLRTKKSAESATEAVDQMTFRLRAFEDHELCRECCSYCDQIERLHELCLQAPQDKAITGAYVMLPEVYRALRRTLIELRTRVKERLSKEQLQQLQSLITKLSGTGVDVSAKLGNRLAASKVNLKTVQQEVQATATILTELSVQLDKRAVGENHE